MSHGGGNTVRVLLFGPEAAAAGQPWAEVGAAEPLTCAQLRGRLAESVPALRPYLTSARFAVNHEFARDDHLVRLGDEVALIGMVSGG